LSILKGPTGFPLAAEANATAATATMINPRKGNPPQSQCATPPWCEHAPL
jgi:hypothetical protein